MYVPKHFEETDVAVLHSLIGSHPLGAWITYDGAALVANHIPFLLDPDRGEHGTLVGHVARANSVWRTFSHDVPSIVIFQGPQSYITPSWYAAKQEHGKVVPTWNFAVVHAHGTPRAIEDRDWLLAHVTRLTDEHESSYEPPWRVSDAPDEFIAQLLGAIVGIEIPISTLVGKWKVSQNRSDADMRGVVHGLRERGDGDSVAMAALVQSRIAATD